MAWKWTRQRARAATLVAEDRLTNEQIAEKVGVARYTVDRWRLIPAFAERVAELVTATQEALKAEGIANKRNRVRTLNELHDRQLRVIAERADDPAMQAIPGGTTGLLVHTYKMAGGREPVVMDEYAVDTGLLNEIRQYQKQAAQELQQWTERIDYADLSTERLIAEARRLGLVPTGDSAPNDERPA